jgi:hypothetical protein
MPMAFPIFMRDENVCRMNRLLAAGLALLERRFGDETFDEGSARTFAELCRAADIMKRSERADKAAKAREKKNKNERADGRDDAASMRAELIRRVECLRRAKGLPVGGKEPPEAS